MYFLEVSYEQRTVGRTESLEGKPKGQSERQENRQVDSERKGRLAHYHGKDAWVD